ncbi:MAG TPA: RluA family pseudouridine synthase, partial [Rhodothermales bacterium]
MNGIQRDEANEWVIALEVPPGYREDARLDVYLTRFLPNASRAKVQQGIRDGRAIVNDRVMSRVSYRVQPGDRIVCRLDRPPPMEARPESIPLDVVYEDDWLIVVNKPAGMVVHPAHGNQTGTLVNALLHHVGATTLSIEDIEDVDEEDVGLSVVNAVPAAPGDPSIRPGIIHRLDKDTSGLLVVAKDDVTHRRLARQFEHRTIRRRYLAIVWGIPDPPSGRIEAPIGRSPRDRKRMAVVPPELGKHAVTHYETVEHQAYTALLRFRLETGRTHQIRVHALHIGHPVLGDVRYDGRRIRYGPDTARRRTFYENLFELMPRQGLHAATLGFKHPQTGEEVDFE